MKTEKIVMWLINLLLTAAMAFAVLILLEQLPAVSWEWYSRSLCCAPVLLCFPAGLLARRLLKLRPLVLIIACLLSSFIIYLVFPSHETMDIIYIVLTVFIGAGVFFLGLRGEEPFPPRVAVASIILYLFICAFFYLNTGAADSVRPATYCAFVNFLLSLYSFNTNSLKSGQHNVKGGSSTLAIPSGLRWRNVLLLTVFIIVTVPIASIDFLQRGLGAGLFFILSAFWKLISALGGSDDSTTVSAATPTPTEAHNEPAALPDVEVNAVGSAIVKIFIVIMLIAALFFILAVIFSGMKNASGRRGSLSAFFKNLFKTREIQGYEDSIERTRDIKGILKQRREKLTEFIEKLTSRPERFEDMPDNRMKVRFAYKALLASSRVNRRALYCTPKELGAQLKQPELTELTELYSEARYNPGKAVSDAEAAKAGNAISSLRRSRKAKQS